MTRQFLWKNVNNTFGSAVRAARNGRTVSLLNESCLETRRRSWRLGRKIGSMHLLPHTNRIGCDGYDKFLRCSPQSSTSFCASSLHPKPMLAEPEPVRIIRGVLATGLWRSGLPFDLGVSAICFMLSRRSAGRSDQRCRCRQRGRAAIVRAGTRHGRRQRLARSACATDTTASV